MAFEIQRKIGLLYKDGRLFINRNDLVATLECSLERITDETAAETISSIKEGLESLTVL